MAYKEKEIEKLYFSIGEVAQKLNVAPSLIRFWESEFDIIRPKKNRNGNRQFTQEDIDSLRLIYHLAKEILRSNEQVLRSKMEMIDSLKKVRGFLTELKELLG